MNRILITRIVVWPYLARMYRRYATSSSRKRQSNNARTARISSSEGLRIFDASRMDMEQRRQHRVCRLHTWVRSFIDHFHGKAESTGVAEQRANVVHVSVAQKDACRGILSSSKRGVAPTSKTIHHGPAGSHPPTHEDESHADAGLRPRGDRVPLSQLHSFVSAGFLVVQWMNESYSNFFTHDSTFSHNWVAPTVANGRNATQSHQEECSPIPRKSSVSVCMGQAPTRS